MPKLQTPLEPSQQEILILAPTGQDSRLLQGALGRAGLAAAAYPTMASLCERLRCDAGCVLIAEEALSPATFAALNATLSTQEAWSDIPIAVMTTGGAATPSSLKMYASFAPNGNVTLLERPFRSVTLTSLLQVALRARRRQYQVRELLQTQREATRIRDEFISIASHELKTPLTSLRLQAQLSDRMLKAENPAAFDPARVRKLVRSTGEQVDRLARLVEDMLDVSRMSAGKLSIQKSEFDLAELVRDLADRFLPQLEAAGCPLDLAGAGEVRGQWDRYRLEQVISNLMTNAIRYAPGKPLRIGLTRQGERARLEFKDHGPGISAENAERIFDRFERAVSAQNISGLGLGLYITRQILEAHSGTIHVESEPGKGATFVIQLPLAG